MHSVGTVLGRANYGEGLVVYQGVNVGGDLRLNFPTIGKGIDLIKFYKDLPLIVAVVFGKN